MGDCENFSLVFDADSDCGDVRRTIVFLGNCDKRTKDPIFDQVFQFCGIDRGNMTVFTRLGGDFSDFFRFLLRYQESFSRAILLFFADEIPPEWERLERIPLPWEAFRVLEDGRFSRIRGEYEPLSLYSWMIVEDLLE